MAVGVAGCAVPASQPPPIATVLVTPSPTWRQTVSAAEFQDRIASLTDRIRSLRADTHSGWIGRQDDVTGYLAELTGGGFGRSGAGDPLEPAGALLAAVGPDLFGIPGTDVLLTQDAILPSGMTVLRGAQMLRGVEVVDGRLVVLVAQGPNGFRAQTIRGRVYPGLDVEPTPAIGAARAREIAASASGGVADPPTLVVLPIGAGRLAWEVFVTGASDPDAGGAVASLYYVDARTGAILSIRAASSSVASVAAAVQLRALAANLHGLALANTGESVDVYGRSPFGGTLRGKGVAASRGGVALVDTTTPFRTGKRGVITTHSLGSFGAGEDVPFPGPIVRSADRVIRDPDAIAAHVYGRYVLDYYFETFGRRSWDGEGAALPLTVHLRAICDNAFFYGKGAVFGQPCHKGGTVLDVDTVAHEITHGVTQSTANLVYSGQAGALNESFSDYFGNLIGDRLKGRDSNGLGEDGCALVPGSCPPDPEGGESFRYMLNGATLDDYLRILAPAPYLSALGFNQDHGGVHLNSAIWNNALWSIRTRLAQIDNTTALQSARVRTFDSAVYLALTTLLTPGSGFLDARSAVERAMIEAGADDASRQVAVQVFDQNVICAGCGAPSGAVGDLVAGAASTETGAAVSGNATAWLDLSIGDLAGGAFVAGMNGGVSPQAISEDASSVAFAGDIPVTTDSKSKVRLHLPVGPLKIGVNDDSSGLAGSAEGAAWITIKPFAIHFVDPSGTVQSTPLKLKENDIVSIATGGRVVAVGTGHGQVLVWSVGGRIRSVRTPFQTVVAVAVTGDHLLAVSSAVPGDEFHYANVMQFYPARVSLVSLSTGQQTLLSRQAGYFGAALNDRYAIWSEATGGLQGRVAEEYPDFVDTDLYLYSLATGTTYDILQVRGEQGFPSLSGKRLVWQDAVNGGDDIYSAFVPDGL